MSYSPITNLTLSKYLKIVYQNGVYNNLDESSAIWDYIKKQSSGDTDGKQLNFAIRGSLGMASAAFVGNAGTTAYPVGVPSTLYEGSVPYKEYAVTIDVDRSIIMRAMKDFGRYAEPLAEEIDSKTKALGRMLAASIYGDGTGVVGTVSSATATGSIISVVLSTADTARGHIGFFEPGDYIVNSDPNGTLDMETSGGGASANVAYYIVQARDFATNTVVLAPKDANGAAVTLAGGGTTVTIDASDLLYRYSQTTRYDLSSTVSTSVDYNSLTELWVGLESLSQNDGRLVNGINLTGNLGGTRRSAGASAIDVQHFQQVMSDIMVNVGSGRYKYDSAFMAYATYDALVNAREVDRRFMTVEDGKRGVKALGYQYGETTLIFKPDVFCSPKRIFIIPKGDVLNFRGKPFDFVRPNGSDKFHLGVNSSGLNTRNIKAYLEGAGALFSCHPAAIGVIHNFTV